MVINLLEPIFNLVLPTDWTLFEKSLIFFVAFGVFVWLIGRFFK